ncbi:MAG: DUF4198 domain-containing protein [Desulfobacterales bacterium]|nr:DUF4198 domain-containing protein [Desulfobacterales bacterium]
MKKQLFFVFTLALCIIVSNSYAHEFIIKPSRLTADIGQKLPLSVLSAHAFMVSEEIEPIDNVKISSINGNSLENIDLKENKTTLTLDGVATTAGHKGTTILAGHRKGMVWTQTTKGWKQAPKNDCKGVISSGKYEKFCKALVRVGKEDKGYDKVIGHALEIVPVSNPAKASAGDALDFKILLNGQPLSTDVYATYDGFSPLNNTYAYFSQCGENGIATVKVTQPGTWMVRVQHKIDKPTEEYDAHILRAVLVFGVN